MQHFIADTNKPVHPHFRNTYLSALKLHAFVNEGFLRGGYCF